MKKIIIFLFVIYILLTSSAFATYLDITSKGAGFGGALVNNSSGVDALYYNPANLSLGVNDFAFNPSFDFSLGSFIDIAKDPVKFLEDSFNKDTSIGGKFGFAMGYTHGGFGIFFRPDVKLSYSKLAGISPLNSSATGIGELGFGYGREIYNGLAIGMNFKYIYSYTYSYLTTSSTVTTMNNTETGQKGKGVAFDLGIRKRINDWLTVGVSWIDLINTQSYTTNTEQSITNIAGDTSKVAGSYATTSTKGRRPVRTLFGIGIQKERFAFEFDVETYSHTTDIHMGAEGILNDKILGRMGFSTDRANNSSALSLGFKAGPISFTANIDLTDSKNNT